MSPLIEKIEALQVYDSRGRPTVAVKVHCSGGVVGHAMVPSGASTGKHEAIELRDGGSQFQGRGVQKAIGLIRDVIEPRLLGVPLSDHAAIDQILIALDGTPNKSHLGANTTLAVSLACAYAWAASRREPLWQIFARGEPVTLPLPMINMISGGLHAGGHLDVQDLLLMPIGARSIAEALEMAVAVYMALSQVLKAKGYDGDLVGDEGGFGPRLSSTEMGLDLLVEAITRVGLRPGTEGAIAIDVASSQFYRDGQYQLRSAAGKQGYTSEGLIEVLRGWVDHYPILSLEDGMAEDDWTGWKALTKALGKRVQLIGDDLFVTHGNRLARGIAEGVANSILIKPNQVGTLTETLQVIDQARANEYRPVVSARSGETEDAMMADLAVGTSAGQIKIGSIVRSERLAKYNRLLWIEKDLGSSAMFAGWEPVNSQSARPMPEAR